ncbi:MAG: tRNA lysidine(34) synthetase TilS, partial [Betaproteobacteria bacterium]|nr:tRNA lysidine(34) synthetase TilS [Betaproteobacteria bacterium]
HVRLLRDSAKFSERGLAETARQIIAARRGETAMQFAGMTFRTWRGRLYLDFSPPPPPFFRIPLEAGRERHELPQLGGALILRRGAGGGLSGGIGAPLFAQLRRGGERLDISGAGVRAVSDLLRAANIAPWRRRRLPLLFAGECLAAVPGVAVAAAFRAGSGEENGIDCRMEWF